LSPFPQEARISVLLKASKDNLLKTIFFIGLNRVSKSINYLSLF
jgi:hypothetical protein